MDFSLSTTTELLVDAIFLILFFFFVDKEIVKNPYVVVETTDEDGTDKITVICRDWLIDKKSYHYPSNKSKNAIYNALLKKKFDSNWPIYQI